MLISGSGRRNRRSQQRISQKTVAENRQESGDGNEWCASNLSFTWPDGHVPEKPLLVENYLWIIDDRLRVHHLYRVSCSNTLCNEEKRGTRTVTIHFKALDSRVTRPFSLLSLTRPHRNFTESLPMLIDITWLYSIFSFGINYPIMCTNLCRRLQKNDAKLKYCRIRENRENVVRIIVNFENLC